MTSEKYLVFSNPDEEGRFTQDSQFYEGLDAGGYPMFNNYIEMAKQCSIDEASKMSSAFQGCGYASVEEFEMMLGN